MRLQSLLIVAATVLSATSASAITIELDYSYDTRDFGTGTLGFFANSSAARDALQAAATDLGNAIQINLAPINLGAGQYVTGSAGNDTVLVNPNWFFTNPTTGAQTMLDGLNLAGNTVRIYVGSQNLGNGVLAQGSIGALGYGSGVSYGSDASVHQTALDRAVTNTNALLNRGSGVTMGGAGNVSMNMGGTTYKSASALTFSPTIGNLWFDSDTDNNGATDSFAQVSSYWNFDYKSKNFTGHNDLYATALHEMMHALGVGTSDAWSKNVTDLVPGGNKDWTGAEVIALRGTGANFVDSGSAHTASGVTGHILSGQSADSTSTDVQASVMVPATSTGVRRTLTDVDVAMLHDMGYTAVPEPSTYGIMSAAGVALVALAKKRRRAR